MKTRPRNGYAYPNCRFCGGAGCLYCESEENRAYKARFPEGPKPVATFRLDDPAQMEQAKALLGPEAMKKHFGKDGGGMTAFLKSLADAQKETPPRGE